jgi:hypothetical protein
MTAWLLRVVLADLTSSFTAPWRTMKIIAEIRIGWAVLWAGPRVCSTWAPEFRSVIGESG